MAENECRNENTDTNNWSYASQSSAAHRRRRHPARKPRRKAAPQLAKWAQQPHASHDLTRRPANDDGTES